MALYYDLPVFQDVYNLVLLLFQYTTNFSREYKYTQCQDMKRDGIVLVRSIYWANKVKEKEQYLEHFISVFPYNNYDNQLTQISAIPMSRDYFSRETTQPTPPIWKNQSQGSLFPIDSFLLQ